MVVNPADIPTTDKDRKQKEDARDSRKIAEQLAASSLVGIHIPNIEIEDVSRFKTSDQFCAYIGLVPMTTHQGSPTGFTG